jgi:TDG/mug DNA glycosylase family protein
MLPDESSASDLSSASVDLAATTSPGSRSGRRRRRDLDIGGGRAPPCTAAVPYIVDMRTDRIRPLPDHLAPGLRAVFVGINPSIASGRAGHHFASPGNPFWRLLHAAGFTASLLAPADDARVVELGLGLTNVCSRPTRSAAELRRRDYARGVRELVRKLEPLRPAVVALVGVTLARVVLPGSAEEGPGPRRGTIAGARVFVLPNPSGRNAAYPGFEAKLAWFVRLRELVERSRDAAASTAEAASSTAGASTPTRRDGGGWPVPAPPRTRR